MAELKLLTVIVQLLLQVLCIVLAYRAFYSFTANGDRSFWWWFIAGFVCQSVRRVLYLLSLAGVEIPGIGFVAFIIVPTIVSACYAVAMVKVIQYIRRRERRERESRAHISALSTRLEKG